MLQNALAELAGWLREQQLSLAFTTYRANRLLFLGVGGGGELKLHERLFDRPMGLFVAGESLWMAARCQIWRLDNLLAPGQLHEGGDRLYVPAVSFTTGDVNAHEVVLTADGEPLFVNTAFSCLAGLAPGCSFAPTWQPPFISQLAADDRCHLNGVALLEGVPTWATACGGSGEPSSWRNQRTGGGVLIHIPSGELAATGLSMPHSPRWHEGRLWLLNSGTGELGWIEAGDFRSLCALPGFVRGLAFAGGCAVVGLSKLRSPQFTGLPLEERLIAEGNPGGCCGLRVIELASGEILHSLDLPEPIDELFDVAVLAGVRQPRALGLQGEAIDCLVKLPDRDELVHVRPLAPSGNPHRGPAVRPFGLPEPSAAVTASSADGTAASAAGGNAFAASPPAAQAPIRYQRVFHLTPANLAPYAALTFPSLAPGSSAVERIQGELLGLSAMASGAMVALAIAERSAEGGARLLSLKVDPAWRRRGIGTGLVQRLMVFLAREGIAPLTVRYKASPETTASLEPILARLGWSSPRTDFVLLEGRSEQLAAIGWADRHPIVAPYRLQAWQELTEAQRAQAVALDAASELQPPADPQGLEPAISLALLHHDAPVGWLLAHRTGAGSVRYSSLFVAPGHRGRGRALALLVEGFRRQHAAGLPVARAAIDRRNGPMLRLLKRHLGAHLSSVDLSRLSQAPPPQAAQLQATTLLPPEPPPPQPEATAALKFQRVFHLTPESLRPYDPFTFPSLQRRWALQPQRGELLGTSASLEGAMVAFAIAECLPDRTAELISLFVAPEHRRRGVAGRLVALLDHVVRQEGCTALIRPQPEPQPQAAGSAVASPVPPELRALFTKARAFQEQGELPEAIAAYQAVLNRDPNLAAAHCNLGAIHQLQGDPEAAAAAYRAALAVNPSFALAHLNLGRLLLSQQRWPEAQACLRRAVELQPGSATAHLELATVQRLLGDTAGSIDGCHAALARQPDLPEAWYSLGHLWMSQGEMANARHCFEQVLQRQSDHLAAHQNLGHVLEVIGEHEAALASYGRALELDPAAIATFVQREKLRFSLADWQPYDQRSAELRQRIETHLLDPEAPPLLPLTVHTLPLPPALRAAVARRWGERKAASVQPLRPPGGFPPPPPPAPRLHLGYLSPDFRQHPVGTLIHQLFQHHDRSRFHISAYALVAADDAYTASIRQGCDAFVDLSGLSPLAAAGRIHADGLHILIDLAGYTTFSQPEILALQPAPIQIHYLGYPGSLGTDFIPYLLADRWLIPPGQRHHYSEEVIELPHAFAGSQLEISADPIDRQEFGLPAEAFVFCCFNRSDKIEPRVLRSWLRILEAVPDSVLWLSQSQPTIESRLRQQAQQQGIDPERLVFSPRLPMERYLAAYRLADLFLDTFLYNAGATAVHALWAGLPLLTCPGEGYAARMGASLCAAAGLEALICPDPAAYEARAIALATSDRPELSSLRRQLIERRDSLPLFDRQGWIRGLEERLWRLWDDHAALEPSIRVGQPG